MNLPLNIDWQQILLHLFNFVLLAGGLYLLLYKPVKGFMDKRTAYYQTLEAETKTKLADAERVSAEYQSRMAGAEDEIQRKKAEVLREAEKKADLILEEARKQKEKILAEADSTARHEKEKMIEDARVEIAELAVAATAKLLREEADPDALSHDKEARHG